MIPCRCCARWGIWRAGSATSPPMTYLGARVRTKLAMRPSGALMPRSGAGHCGARSLAGCCAVRATACATARTCASSARASSGACAASSSSSAAASPPRGYSLSRATSSISRSRRRWGWSLVPPPRPTSRGLSRCARPNTRGIARRSRQPTAPSAPVVRAAGGRHLARHRLLPRRRARAGACRPRSQDGGGAAR